LGYEKLPLYVAVRHYTAVSGQAERFTNVLHRPVETATQGGTQRVEQLESRNRSEAEIAFLKNTIPRMK